MPASKTMVLTVALAVAGAAVRAEAAGFAPPTGQHAAVLGSIQRAQQRNNAVIDHVQRNIRAGRSRHF